MDVSSIVNTANSGNTGSSSTNAADTQDRFLKLLIAQMKNQDPMNPMDNAQVTSQMAQIQTVSGVNTLNTSIQSLGSKFSQMQALQSVSLVGRNVTVAGSKLGLTQVGEQRVGSGAYELSGPADKVKLEVLSPAGAVVDTIDLGAQSTGMQNFNWPADRAPGFDSFQFRITATRGAAQVSTSTYTQDRVTAINTSGASLQLQLASLGMVDYSAIKAVN